MLHGHGPHSLPFVSEEGNDGSVSWVQKAMAALSHGHTQAVPAVRDLWPGVIPGPCAWPCPGPQTPLLLDPLSAADRAGLSMGCSRQERGAAGSPRRLCPRCPRHTLGSGHSRSGAGESAHAWQSPCSAGPHARCGSCCEQPVSARAEAMSIASASRRFP